MKKRLFNKNLNKFTKYLYQAICLLVCISQIIFLFTPTILADSSGLRNSTYNVDPDTTDSYQDALINNINGSRYAGRIWSDKSVFRSTITLDNDTDGYAGTINSNSDFLHVFSTLGSSIQQNNYSKVPVDLVIAIDMSASMAQDTRYSISSFTDEKDGKYAEEKERTMKKRIANSRVQKTLDAANNTIDYLMKQNINNRVSVVVYGAGAAVIMPLSHYKRVDSNTPYLSVGGMETLYSLEDLTYDEELGWLWTRNLDACYTIEVKALKDDEDNPTFSSNTTYTFSVSNNVKNTKVKANPGYEEQNETNLMTNQHKNNTNVKGDNEHYKELKADKYIGYFTNTQGGIYLAYSQLAETDKTTINVKTVTNRTETLARIPAAIIMTDGGANFAFNEVGEWGEFYGNVGKEFCPQDSPSDNDNNICFRKDNLWYQDKRDEKNLSHSLGAPTDQDHNTGDEWYKVYLPGIKDSNEITTLNNFGMEKEEGTLTSAPVWDQIGILYSNDADILGTSATILQLLMTASYMKTAVNKHYEQGWEQGNALDTTRIKLSTYTISVDAANVPQWGKFRLYPSMDPANYPLDSNSNWWDNEEKFGPELTQFGDIVKKATVFTGMLDTWKDWVAGKKAIANANATTVKMTISPLPEEGDNSFGVTVTNQDVIDNIVYNDGFYDADSEDVEEKFLDITSTITGNIFVPISGVNEDGVSDSLTYNDPIGKYMEVKDDSITVNDKTYSMALLLFGQIHGIVKTGVYDYNFNLNHRGENHNSNNLQEKFTMGWYDKDGNYLGDNGSWANGDTYYLDVDTIKLYVPTINEDENLTEEERNKTYVIYRFAESTGERNKDIKNISYGENSKVTFKLSDIRVWVEKDKSREEYNDMLFVNIPVQALPLQTVYVEVNEEDENEVKSYRTNLDNKLASTPLRLFYGVGVCESLLINNRKDVDTDQMSDEYLEEYTKDGYIYFYSNYYSKTLYDGYTADTLANARTRGDPVTTFSPSEDNRYYVFQKNLILYSKAYIVQADGSLKEITDEEAKNFEGANYYGELEENTESVTELMNKGEISAGDIVTYSTDKVKYSSNPASDTYYFMAIDYYVPTDNNGGKRVQFMVSRLGSEFGSGILGDQVSEGEYVCWYDESGTFSETYDYKAEIPSEKQNGNTNWVLATKIGGLRIGDLHQGIHIKEENVTETSNSYYLPIIADDKSRAGYDAVLDAYLGNNGLLIYKIEKWAIPDSGSIGRIVITLIGITLIILSSLLYKRHKRGVIKDSTN